MSLKGFHIVFITLSMLCAFGFAVWTLLSRNDANTSGVRALGIASAFSGIGLAVYGVWFYRKIRNAPAL